MTSDWVHAMGHSPICQTLWHILCGAAIMASPVAWICSTGMLSIPADLFIFKYFTAVSIYLWKIACWSLLLIEHILVSWSCMHGQVEEYAPHLVRMSWSSVRQFSSLSWIMVVHPCLHVVISFTSWLALLLLFLNVRISSIFWNRSPIEVSFALFMLLIIFCFTSLYVFPPSVSVFFFLNSLPALII